MLAGIAGSVLLLDLWTKRWAIENLADRPPIEIIGEFVRLTYTLNSGVAFGLGAGYRFPYYLFSIAAVLVILYLFLSRRVQSGARQVALSLIMGGALGNLVDRLKTGVVVDFIEIGFHRWHWPVFNVADSAVTIGVVMFALAWSSHGPDAAPAVPEGGATTPSEQDAHAADLHRPNRVSLDEPDARPVGSHTERG
jgi:signal peptidase II